MEKVESYTENNNDLELSMQKKEDINYKKRKKNSFVAVFKDFRKINKDIKRYI